MNHVGADCASGLFNSLLDSEPVGLVFIEYGNGKVLTVKISEWVPMTHFGTTNVKWNQHELNVPAPIKTIRGVAYESVKQFEIGVDLSCDEKGECEGSVNYEQHPEEIKKDSLNFSEKKRIDGCSGFTPTKTSSYMAQSLTCTSCDSLTEKITTTTKSLTHPIYPPSTNQIP